MVHALEEARRALKPGGVLIDLKPTARNRRVELELAGARLHIGEIDGAKAAEDKRLADAALNHAVDSGRFRREHHERFEYVSDLDTVADLREFAASLRRSVMPPALPRRIQELTAGSGDFRIRIRREMSIGRYRAL